MPEEILDEFKFNTDALADGHGHLRKKREVVRDNIKHSINGGADSILAIPNFENGLSTVDEVLAYDAMAREQIPEGYTYNILPTMMVNEFTPLDELRRAADQGIRDVKFLPFLRSTNSKFGFRKFWKTMPQIKVCGEEKIRVHVHPEHPLQLFGNRQAEYACLTFAEMALSESPDAVFFWEHGTDARCIPFWEEFAKTGRFFVTLTAHHLDSNEEDAFGDVRRTCKPPIKTERDRIDLCRLVAMGLDWPLSGGDAAPHQQESKHVDHGHCACGAATAPFLARLYAHALHPYLDLKTEKGQQFFKKFTSDNPRRVLGLPPASRQITLINKPSYIPLDYPVGDWKVMSYGAGEMLDWSIKK